MVDPIALSTCSQPAPTTSFAEKTMPKICWKMSVTKGKQDLLGKQTYVEEAANRHKTIKMVMTGGWFIINGDK